MHNEMVIIWNGMMVNVTKSSQKRRGSVSFKIRDGKVYVTAWLKCPTDYIYDALSKKENWIMKHLENPRIRASFSLDNGSDIYVLGKRYKLQLVNSSRGKMELSGDTCFIYGPSEKSWVNAYKNYAENLLDELLDKFRSQLRYDVGDYTLKYRFYKSRWGCCFFRRREVVMNYYCIAMEEEAIKYVFYHELAHLSVGNHSKDFYSHLAKLDPSYKIGLKKSKSYTIA